MTISNINEFVYDWIEASLNDETPIIQGSQDAPRPQGLYLVIHRPYGLRQAGYAYKSYVTVEEKTRIIEVEDDDDIIEEYLEGSRKQVNVYTIVVSIEEVNGLGEKLTKIINKLEFDEIQQYFRDNNVSCLNNFGIIPRPFSEGKEWYMGASIDFTLSFSMTEKEIIEWVDSVEIDGSVDA